MKAFQPGILTLALCLASASVEAAPSSLLDLELEQLMEMNVTTVTKRTQSYRDSAAAVFIITQDDIRRSGATVLPEVLDLAPGISTARINNFLWGVTARGELSQYAEKLLVMVDGRSVYHPYLSGVFWESVLPSLNEIERIEIIRGPGTSIWGANAVNGIINIITYDSEMTTNARASFGVGNEERGFTRLRQGFRSGSLTGRFNVDLRITDDAYSPELNRGAQDDMITHQLSTRLDWRPTTQDIFTIDSGATETYLNGNFYVDEAIRGAAPADEKPPLESYGSESGWLASNWLHELSSQDGIQLKAYVDWEDREEQVYSYSRITSDIDFQYNFRERNGHRVTWGAGARHIEDESQGGFILSFSEDKLFYDKYTAFLQDELQLTEKLTTTLGVKHENNDFTKPQTQPSMRLGYRFNDSMFAWASASRAARTPATMSHVWNWKFGAPPELSTLVDTLEPGISERTFVEAIGSFDFESEIATTYELGYRALIASRTIFDVAIYYSDLENLRNLTFQGIKIYPPADDQASPYISYLGQLKNDAKGNSKGVEIFAKTEVTRHWTTQLGYTYTELTSKDELAYGTDFYPTLSYITPKHTIYLLSRHSLTDLWNADLRLKHVDERYNDEVFGYSLPAFDDLVVRLSHKWSRDVTVAIVGKQLLDSQRAEITGTFLGPAPTEVERSIFIELSWR